MINLWQGDITERLLNGELVMQSGTWVLCGTGSRPSRYIGTNGKSLNVAHYPHTSGDAFSLRVALHKLQNGLKLSARQRTLAAPYTRRNRGVK